jgi:diacylglycerol kinase
MPIKIRRLVQSFKYAFKGVIYSFKEEQNIKIHFIVTAVIIIFAIYFRISALEIIALIIVIFFVIAMELVNTILERVVDIIKPRMHPYAKNIKDMQAAVVLMAAIASILVGIIIFLPKILELF